MSRNFDNVLKLVADTEKCVACDHGMLNRENISEIRNLWEILLL